mgnify:CR=1 FL=1
MTSDLLPISMSSPDLTDLEREAVAAVLRTPNLSMGKEITLFEAAFTRLTGLKHAIGVNSGTAGLHLCVHAAGIQAGDRVITTPFSFVASTNALLFERAVPVFVDVDPVTGNIDPARVEQSAAHRSLAGHHGGAGTQRKGEVYQSHRTHSPIARLSAGDGSVVQVLAGRLPEQ